MTSTERALCKARKDRNCEACDQRFVCFSEPDVFVYRVRHTTTQDYYVVASTEKEARERVIEDMDMNEDEHVIDDVVLEADIYVEEKIEDGSYDPILKDNLSILEDMGMTWGKADD